MKGKIKTSIVVDEGLWERFKVKVDVEKGLKGLSNAVEEALEEELNEEILLNALGRMSPSKPAGMEVTPVKPRVRTSAGEAVKEARSRRL